MRHSWIRTSALAALSGILLASVASAQSPMGGDLSPFVPRVPVSAFAHPLSLFDPSQLHISSMVSVGSGFGGGTNALQITSLSYHFKAPLSMSVSVGNAWGPQSFGNSSPYLAGVDLTYHPSASSIFEFRFQNVRSPLQYGYGSRYWAP